jgi:hypothetical protein
MDDTFKFFSTVLPDPSDAYVVLWWQTSDKKADGTFRFAGEAFRTIEEMAKAHPVRAGSDLVRTLYYCVSLQKDAGRQFGTRGLWAIRTVANTVALKVLFVDLDVKEVFYATTAEALQALFAFCDAIGLPYPTVSVYTSAPTDGSEPVTSGVHLYWVFDRILTVEAWKPLARLFSNALQYAGVKFDLNVPTNAAWVGRAPGSINRKKDTPRIARLGPGSGETHDVEKFRAILEAAQPPQRERSRDRGLDLSAPADLAEVAEAVEFLTQHGHYGSGQYVNVRNLYFALALVVIANPELYDASAAIMHRVVAANGRDPDKNAAWFQQAIERAPSWAGQDAVTLRSTFAAALRLGWRPPLTDEQQSACRVGKQQLRATFRSNLPRATVLARAARIVDHALDPLVRLRLGNACAAHLVRCGVPDNVVREALSLAARAEITSLPTWLNKFRSAAR